MTELNDLYELDEVINEEEEFVPAHVDVTDELRDALTYLDPDESHTMLTYIKPLTWAHIGLAIYEEQRLGNITDGFSIWNSWCEQSDSYRGQDALEKMWELFPTRNKGKLTVRHHVFSLAISSGWDRSDLALSMEDTGDTDVYRIYAKMITNSGDWKITKDVKDIVHMYMEGRWKSYQGLHAISFAASEWAKHNMDYIARGEKFTSRIASRLMGALQFYDHYMQPPAWGVVPLADGLVIDATGEVPVVRDAVREDYITSNSDIVLPTDDGKPEVFNKVISDLADGRKHFEDYFKSLLAKWIFRPNDDQSIFVLQGPGGTGKNTFLSVVQNVLEDLFFPISAHSFNNFSLGRLPVANPRVLVFDEVTNMEKLQLTLNQLTDGGMKMQLEAKNVQQTSYLYKGHVIILCNNSPDITNPGTQRRMIGVPFRKQFYTSGTEGKVIEDREIRDKMRKELPYILRELLTYVDKDVIIPEEVVAKTDEISKVGDSVSAWWEECVDVDSGDGMIVNDMYKHYVTYCETNDLERNTMKGTNGITKDAFRRKINEKNLEVLGKKGKSKIYKVSLRSLFS